MARPSRWQFIPRTNIVSASLVMAALAGMLIAATQPSACMAQTDAPRENAAAPNRPNVIFLLTDDQRWDTLGCMGNQIIQTPNIDRLAEQGVVFDNCFVTTAICMTSRACIFTGQYAARHGVVSFRTNFTRAQLEQTYPARLKEAGYHIGFIGKWGVGQPPEDLFDYNKGWPGQSKYFHQIDGRFKYIRFIDTDPTCEELYDLAADPDEAHNLATEPEHSATLRHMRQKWQTWRERAK